MTRPPHDAATPAQLGCWGQAVIVAAVLIIFILAVP
jgi:hypothetical protein